MTNEEKNEEKANEICKRHIFDSNLYDGCMEMAEWKEQQMIEKAVNFLNENLMRTLLFDKYDKENFIDNFRKAMK